MTDIIEAVARAISDAEDKGLEISSTWDRTEEWTKDLYRTQARAAVEAYTKAVSGEAVLKQYRYKVDDGIGWSNWRNEQSFMPFDVEVDVRYLFAAPQPAVEAYTKATSGEPQPDSLLEYYKRQIEWSRMTFGPGLRTKGTIQHITKELAEIAKDPNDLLEWVDVIILAMDGFWRHGGDAEQLLPVLIAKQKKNMARTWPDWRDMTEDQAIEHDRSGEAPVPQSVASIVPEHCSASTFVFVDGCLTVRKDGSGYVVVNEKDFEIEDESDGESVSSHWITRFPPDQMTGLRDFLNGQNFNVQAPAGWKLVPVDPTLDMIMAGIVQRHGETVPEAWKLATENIYREMIKFAPEPGASA